jgi:hypothetical protein
MIAKRNQKNLTKYSIRYVAKDFYWVQPARMVFEHTVIGEEA